MSSKINDSLYNTIVNDVLLVTKLGDCPNLEFDCTKEKINWENIDAKNDWLLQKYPVPNGYYRILDGKGIRKAWGSERAMEEKFKRLTRDEFLEPGDVIGVTRNLALGLYDHYAVYIGNDRVIHFAAENGDFSGNIRIHEAPMSEFLGKDKEYFVLMFGEKEEDPIKIYHSTKYVLAEGLVFNTLKINDFSNYRLYSPEETVERAKKVASLTSEQQKEYWLPTNNCEHFAVWCKTGVAESYQVSRTAETLFGPYGKDVIKVFGK